MASTSIYDECLAPSTTTYRQEECPCPRCGYRMQFRYPTSQLEMNKYMDEARYYARKEAAYTCEMFMRSQIMKPRKSMQITALAKRILDPDTRALIKAGWLNNDLSITSEGRDAFLAYFLSENKKKLAEQAKVAIEEKKSECL